MAQRSTRLLTTERLSCQCIGIKTADRFVSIVGFVNKKQHLIESVQNQVKLSDAPSHTVSYFDPNTS